MGRLKTPKTSAKPVKGSAKPLTLPSTKVVHKPSKKGKERETRVCVEPGCDVKFAETRYARCLSCRESRRTAGRESTNDDNAEDDGGNSSSSGSTMLTENGSAKQTREDVYNDMSTCQEIIYRAENDTFLKWISAIKHTIYSSTYESTALGLSTTYTIRSKLRTRDTMQTVIDELKKIKLINATSDSISQHADCELASIRAWPCVCPICFTRLVNVKAPESSPSPKNRVVEDNDNDSNPRPDYTAQESKVLSDTGNPSESRLATETKDTHQTIDSDVDVIGDGEFAVVVCIMPGEEDMHVITVHVTHNRIVTKM